MTQEKSLGRVLAAATIVLTSLTACERASETPPPAPPSAPAAAEPAVDFQSLHADAPGIAWFDGDVDAAFAAAQASNKPVLLYWGAKWCPPCKQLKSAVFSRPRSEERRVGKEGRWRR